MARKIDVLTKIDGVGFPEAWKERSTVEVEGIRLPVIGRRCLIKNKQAAGRKKDLFDLDLLNEVVD